MGKLFRLLFVLVIISSCSKNKNTTDSAAGEIKPDTLTAGWSKIISLPKENFRDIFFPDNSTGYTVSNNGIYKSTNSGDAWTKINPSTTATNIGAGSSERACFPDGGFSVLLTQDGGTTFPLATYPYPGGGTVGFSSCFFTSPSTCYFNSNQYAWKSVDGGLSLDTLYRFPKISATSSTFFLNDLQGWVVRQDGLYQTADGGNSWNMLIVDSSLNAYGSVQFLDSDNGYFSNYGVINKTTDGGLTWLPVYQAALQVYADLAFVSLTEGYFCSGNRIYKTSDAGITWLQVASLGNEFINRIHFTDASHGWACTTDGTVLKFAL